MRQEPIVLSYYTKGTYYEKDAERLAESCRQFSLEHRIEGIEPFGKWFEHICHKPHFILKQMKELKRPVLWMDADSEFVQKPTLFPSIKTDVSLRIYEKLPPDHPCYFFAGTIYFDYKPKTVQLVETWAEECKAAVAICPEGKEVWDQTILKRVLFELKEKVTLGSLPAGYAAIFDSEEDNKEDLFIIHYQASRLYKRFINEEVASFALFDELNIDELRSLRPKLNFKLTKE